MMAKYLFIQITSSGVRFIAYGRFVTDFEFCGQIRRRQTFSNVHFCRTHGINGDDEISALELFHSYHNGTV